MDDWVRFWVLFLVGTQRFNARSLSFGIVHSIAFSVVPSTSASYSYPPHIPTGIPRYLLPKRRSLTWLVLLYEVEHGHYARAFIGGSFFFLL